MARIMIVAGGDWQVELVKKAKEMGHYVICSNLYEDSPAFKHADACEVADILDKDLNLKIARKHSPDAVISDQSDLAVPTVAYLNECLGLKGIGIDKADLFTDKSMQREFCKNNDIAIPDYTVCDTADDAISLLEKYGKIVIKPIDSQSSRGVFTITNKEDLKEKFNEAASWSNRRRVVLAEEYIEGDEFTVDGLVVDGTHYPLCISIKEMYPNNNNISRTQSYSYLSDKYDYDLLRKTNKDLIEKAGLSMGLTHSEYRERNGIYYLVESGARGGGSNLSAKIVPFMSGVDNYEYLINEALAKNVSIDNLKSHKFSTDRYVIMRFFDFKEGVVDHVEGEDYLKHHPMMIDYQLEIEPGSVLKKPAYGRLRPGHFIIGGDSKNDVEAEANAIVEKVRVVYSQ